MNPDQTCLFGVAAAPDTAPVAMPGSPMAQALHTQLLSANAETQRVAVVFDVGPTFTQAAGVVQGGAVAAMLDFVLAYAALLAVPRGQSVATATLNVAFLRPAPAGRLTGTGRVERAGRQMVFAAAELLDAAGHCVATASAALPVVPWRTATSAETSG